MPRTPEVESNLLRPALSFLILAIEVMYASCQLNWLSIRFVSGSAAVRHSSLDS